MGPEQIAEIKPEPARIITRCYEELEVFMWSDQWPRGAWVVIAGAAGLPGADLAVGCSYGLVPAARRVIAVCGRRVPHCRSWCCTAAARAGPGGGKEGGVGGKPRGTLGLWGRVPPWFPPARG
jgi:hypothetical protein